MRREVALACQFFKLMQRRARAAVLATRLLQPRQHKVARCNAIHLNQQHRTDHLPALRQQVFGGVEVVPFPQQIAHPEIVGRRIGYRPQCLLWRRLSGLAIGHGRLP